MTSVERLDNCRWRVPRGTVAGMRVDGILFADDALCAQAKADKALEQVANVACLPGIVGASLAMPDIHWGYGFCIGGVAAMDPGAGGVISPGGVGYDINCGVRMLRTSLEADEARGRLDDIVNQLFRDVPCGMGHDGKYRFRGKELRRLLTEGPSALARQGLAPLDDIEMTESRGRVEGADPDALSERALERGEESCGTLGSGNHFLEIQVVEEIFDARAALVMGLFPGQVCVMIHSGSRGLGYQVCDDTLRDMRDLPRQYGISLPDRQLVSAPIHSPEGRRYFGAMAAAANFAWANRQLIATQTREAFERVFRQSWEHLGMRQVYDVAHNIAQFETHSVDGADRTLLVHRKGATRALPPGHALVPEKYRAIGQPVLIPGDMGRASWVLVGKPGAMERSFGSCCHGAGRLLSRTAAVKAARGTRVDEALAARGIVVRAQSRQGLAEEAPEAYKDVDAVVEVVERAGLAGKVARLRPMGVIKG